MKISTRRRASGGSTEGISLVRRAALDQEPVSGLTHQYYRYPARFSPRFVRAAIEAFSAPGDVVLDPFMGGGTTIVEAFAAGRRAIGNDVNSLAFFVTSTKLLILNDREKALVKTWAHRTVPNLRCNSLDASTAVDSTRIPRNMTSPQTRWLKKAIGQCLASIEKDAGSEESRQFARCAVLNVGQWALNGRRRVPTVSEFRERIGSVTEEMLGGMDEQRNRIRGAGAIFQPLLIEGDAVDLPTNLKGCKIEAADLVVTSPPYPGIHMLYHRWQVDGRKESDAPYWIAASKDGAGAAFYNFADRRREAEDRYFEKAEAAFRATRVIVRKGAIIVQLIAFSEPERQLRRYLSMMARAGYAEHRYKCERRTWRDVPSRRWHANSKGELPSSREVLLLHEAV